MFVYASEPRLMPHCFAPCLYLYVTLIRRSHAQRAALRRVFIFALAAQIEATPLRLYV